MPDIFDMVAQPPKPKEDVFDLVAGQQKVLERDLFDRVSKTLAGAEERKYDYVPPGEEASIGGYYRWLHTPTEPAESFGDWFNRVVPTSISKTAMGVLEFPYMTIKSFTDPWFEMKKEISAGKEKPEAVEEALIKTGKAPIDLVTGLGQFFGEPIGLYGWEKMKEKWFADPAAGALAITPWIKAGRMPRGTSPLMEVSRFGEKPTGIKGFPRRVYEWADVRAPFERIGAHKTATAFQGFPTVKIIENQLALEVVGKIRKLKIPVEQGELLTRRIANSIPPEAVSPKINRAAEILVKDYHDAFKRLQAAKALRSEWPYSWVERNTKRIPELQLEVEMLKNELRVEARKARSKTVGREEIASKTTREFERKTSTAEGPTPELPKMAEAWRGRIKEALDNRGYSPGEVSIALDFVKDRADIGTSIGQIIREATTETIKTERIVNTIIERVMPDAKKTMGIRKKINTANLEIQQLKDINKQIETLKPSYEHIPLGPWFNKIRDALGDIEGSAVITRQFSSRLYRGRFFRQRKTIDIGEIIDWLKTLKDTGGKPIFKPIDFDARMIRAYYAQKAGTIRGLANIFESAKGDGLLIPKTKSRSIGFGEAPPEWIMKFPELKNHWIHENFMNSLDGYIAKVGPSMGLGRIMGYTKMMAFHNPIFLSGYDLRQMFWATFPTPWKIPKYVIKGMKSRALRDATYWEASENLTFSTPYAPPWENFVRDVQSKMEHRLAVRAANRLKQYWKLYPILDDFYRCVWNTAWYGDQGIRMGTYHHFKDRGLSPAMAGEWTRTLHADYSRLSPEARRIANKIAFTPTFKYTMGHVQANMIKSSVNIMRDALNLEKPHAKDVMFAKAGLGLIGALLAQDFIMKRAGYKVDAMGLRYTKEVETEEGTRELVIYIPSPDNVILRQVLKWSNWQDDPQKIESFINKIHWDLHPLWSTAVEIVQNQRPGGEVVYDPFDAPSNPEKIALDIAKHATTRIIGIFGFVEKRIIEQGSKTAHKQMQKDLGRIWASILEPVTLAYLRKPKFSRDVYRIRKLQSLFRWYTAVKNPPKTDEEAQRRINNFFERLNKFTEDWVTEEGDIFDKIAIEAGGP